MNADYLKAYVRRSQAYLATEKLDDCLAGTAGRSVRSVDYDKILELEPSLTQYAGKRRQLAKRIEERNEKLKEEMLGKLKDVGNKILGKFGMSLDNFKMEQDPATGGYSIKFEKSTVCHKHAKRFKGWERRGSAAAPCSDFAARALRW